MKQKNLTQIQTSKILLIVLYASWWTLSSLSCKTKSIHEIILQNNIVSQKN